MFPKVAQNITKYFGYFGYFCEKICCPNFIKSWNLITLHLIVIVFIASWLRMLGGLIQKSVHQQLWSGNILVKRSPGFIITSTYFFLFLSIHLSICFLNYLLAVLPSCFCKFKYAFISLFLCRQIGLSHISVFFFNLFTFQSVFLNYLLAFCYSFCQFKYLSFSARPKCLKVK